MMHRIWAAVATVGLLMSGACGDDGGDGGDADTEDDDDAAPTEVAAAEPTGWEVIEESEVDPVSIEEEPLWGSDTGEPPEFLASAVFHEDAVVMFGGEDGMATNRLTVLDAETGEVHWSVGEGDDLQGGDGARLWQSSVGHQEPVVVGQGGDWAVVVGYIETVARGRQGDPGVAALSGETGEVLWKTPLVPTRPDSAPEPVDFHVEDLAADGGTVAAVIMVEPWEAPGDGPVPVVFGLDAAGGTIRWENTDLPALDVTYDRGLVVTDETVLLRLGAEEADEEQYTATVQALDGLTGEVRWERTGHGDSADFEPTALGLMAADDVALVQIPTEESSGQSVDQGVETLVLEAATGEEVASFGTTANNCVSDGAFLFACQVSDGGVKLATFDVETRGEGVSAQAMSVFFGYGGGVAYGRVFGGDQDRGVAMDRGANILDEAVPGWFLTASDGYVMLREPEQSAGIRYAVHRVVTG